MEMDEKKAKKPTEQNCFYGPINMQMVAMDYQVYFYVVPPSLKYDQLKESPRKAECYAFQDKVGRLSKLNSNFKVTYFLP